MPFAFICFPHLGPCWFPREARQIASLQRVAQINLP